MSEAQQEPTADYARVCSDLISEVGKVLVGQEEMVSRLLMGLLTGGHVLLEGVPGLAKTLAVKSLAEAIDTGFSRIQFTPDMLPADVIGTEIFNPKEATYSIKKGPIFSNLDPCGRDQPGSGQGAGGVARSHAGEADDDRRTRPTSWKIPSSCWRRRTPSSRREPTRCRRRRSTASCSRLKIGYPTKAEEERKIIDRMASGQAEPRITSRTTTPADLLAARKDRGSGVRRREGEALRRGPRARDPRLPPRLGSQSWRA